MKRQRKEQKGGWGRKHTSSREWIIYFFKIAHFLRHLTHEVTQNKTRRKDFSGGITYNVVNEGQEVALSLLVVL